MVLWIAVKLQPKVSISTRARSVLSQILETRSLTHPGFAGRQARCAAFCWWRPGIINIVIVIVTDIAPVHFQTASNGGMLAMRENCTTEAKNFPDEFLWDKKISLLSSASMLECVHGGRFARRVRQLMHMDSSCASGPFEVVFLFLTWIDPGFL